MKTFYFHYQHLFVLIAFLLLPAGSMAAATDFDSLFAAMSKRAREYPREKVFLHFDNTSYYQGDTIWFSAIVVTAADNRPSAISRPLYVELLDQLGNIVKRITVRLDGGRGSGCLPLSDAYFTGYYEVRAYTKWMLSFGGEDYFSRVFPVYRHRVNSTDEPRSIAGYNGIGRGMKQRPVLKEDRLSVRFYPEGGHLVEGVPSTVGFEVMSADSGAVNASGILYSAEGVRISPLQALHDGRGSFSITPGGRAARAEFTWNGRRRSFTLPAALKQGYVLHSDNRGDCVDVTVRRSSEVMNDPLAVFVFGGGLPLRYVKVNFDGLSSRFRLMTSDIPAGVSHLALIDGGGRIVAERFFFVEPRDTLSLTCKSELAIYAPNSRVRCTLRLTHCDGTPVSNAPLSVSVRDAAESDYKAYDNSLTTDLLLTSDLRGYIDRPGFYFREHTARSRMLLDQLLLVRGWRRYSIYEGHSLKPREPLYAPEQRLILYGRVKSLFDRPQPGIGVSLFADSDSTRMFGMTVADDEGYFSVPVDGFSGTVPTVIQTRRQGKKANRWTRVSVFRRFEPELRAYEYEELHPSWQSPWRSSSSGHEDVGHGVDSLLASSEHLLDNTTVTARRRRRNALYRTEMFERGIIGNYNIRDFVERRADEGKPVYNFADMLRELDPDFTPDEGCLALYKGGMVIFLLDGKGIEDIFIKDAYNQMESMLVYRDVGRAEMLVADFDSITFRKTEKLVTSAWSDTEVEGLLGAPIIFANITMSPGWTTEKFYKPRRGIRHTYIQGYETPAEYYTPDYSMAPPVHPDRRRTLYWNSSLVTNSRGEVEIDCWNNSSSTSLTVSAEALSDGKPASVLFNSY